MLFFENINILQNIVHYSLHLIIFPGFVAYIFHHYFNTNWKYVFLLMILTMLVDLDHLFVTPIFDPNRCSVGFHFLHSYIAIFGYFILLFFKKTRIIGIGLLLHTLTDFQDCLWF